MKAVLDKIISAATYIGMFIILGIAALTGMDVCGRYIFTAPVKGTFELTEALFSCIVALGIAATTAADEHIMVDAIFVKLGPSGQRASKLTANLIAISVLAVLIWQGIVSVIDSISAHEGTVLLSVPIYPFRFVLTFGFFLSSIVLIYQTVNLFRSKTD